MQWSRCPSLSLQSGCCYDCQGTTPQSHSWKTKGKMSVKEITTNTEQKKKEVVIYRWEPAPPELTLSASLVAADARDRLEPDWALLRLSAM